MMTTVAQMIEWMKTIPQDAEVKCGVEVTKGYDTWMAMKPVDIECCNVFDYSDEESRKMFPEMGGRVVVMICGE
jgi:hypothetical protein